MGGARQARDTPLTSVFRELALRSAGDAAPDAAALREGLSHSVLYRDHIRNEKQEHRRKACSDRTAFRSPEEAPGMRAAALPVLRSAC